MIETILKNHVQTVGEITRMACQWYNDWPVMEALSLVSIYERVRSLSYIPDPGIETLSRPAYHLSGKSLPVGFYRDCGQKTLLMVSGVIRYNRMMNDSSRVKMRVVAAGVVPGEPGHIYPELLVNDEWIPHDATFPENQIGVRMFTEGHREEYHVPCI